MIFINFKSSYQGTAEKATELIKVIKEVQLQTSTPIIPVVHDFDVFPIRQIYDGGLWIQHADYGYGETGKNSPETISDSGLRINGAFLNHSEHRYENWDKLALVVKECRVFGIKSLVFAAGEGEVIKVGRMKPDFIGYEPSCLIGSHEESVVSEKPEMIRKVAETCKGFGIPLIVGAGIHSRGDVKKSLELGAVGVAVSSFVVSAKDPKKATMELIEGFRK